MKTEPRLKISIEFFNDWSFDWSCTETTWRQMKYKLRSPISIGIIAAIVFGAGTYGAIQVHKTLNPAVPHEVPMQQK
jgi:hypothetical protein